MQFGAPFDALRPSKCDDQGRLSDLVGLTMSEHAFACFCLLVVSLTVHLVAVHLSNFSFSQKKRVAKVSAPIIVAATSPPDEDVFEWKALYHALQNLEKHPGILSRARQPFDRTLQRVGARHSGHRSVQQTCLGGFSLGRNAGRFR